MDYPKIVAEFLHDKADIQKSTPATVRAYIIGLRQFESCLQNLTSLEAPEADMAVKMHAAMLMRNGLKPISCKAYMTVHSSFLNWCHENGYRSTPYRKFKLKVPKLLPNFLSRPEFMALLNVPVDTQPLRRGQLVCRVIMDTGCRSSEVLGIKLVDISENAVRVYGKGQTERWVPVLEDTRARILAFAAEFPNEHGYVFATMWGKRLGVSGMLKDLKCLAKLAGLGSRRVWVHQLRHTFASHYVNGGGSVKALQLQLGHSSIETTNRYVAASDAMVQHDHAGHSPLVGV